MKTVKADKSQNALEIERERLQKSLAQIEDQLNNIEKQQEKEFLASPEYKKINELIQKLTNYKETPFTAEKEFQIKFGLKALVNCKSDVNIHMFVIDHSNDLETFISKEELESYSFCSDIFKFSPVQSDLPLKDLSNLIIDSDNRNGNIGIDSYIKECKNSIAQVTKLKSYLNKIKFNIKFKLIIPFNSDGGFNLLDVKIKALDVGDAIKPRAFRAAIEEFHCVDFIDESSLLNYADENNPNVQAKAALKKELNEVIAKLEKSSKWNETAKRVIDDLDLNFKDYYID